MVAPRRPLGPSPTPAGSGVLGGVTGRELALPLSLVAIVGLMILPLPPLLLDLLLAGNITLSLLMMLTAINIRKPLDFSVFPSLLLVATLFRLALNISTTRLILLYGHEGTQAAGSIVQTFGDFVVGGSYVVGAVVFLILTIINFVVITKGSGRIAEVSARFTLDALPGKQMSIDSDLASGLITQEQARARRSELAFETDFYGAMDGSSKFVRGDAIAGLIITAINIVGGLVIGAFQQDMSIGDAAQTYTILTIGDGLVSQIPALLVSTAAGMVVTRSGTGDDLGRQFVTQTLGRPKILIAAAIVVAGLALVPGMPILVLAGIAALLVWGARTLPEILQRSQPPEAGAPDAAGGPGKPGRPPRPGAPQGPTGEESLEQMLPIRALELQVGFGLIPLVDGGTDGELVQRVAALRKNIVSELGIILPPIHLRDNLELRPGGYRLLIHGVTAIEGEVMADRVMAMDPGDVRDPVDGIQTTEPAFGLPALWIKPSQQAAAELKGYTVVPPAAVIITHVSEALLRDAHRLIGREELQTLLEVVADRSPRVVDELVPSVLSHVEVLAVLRGLLREQVSIRDMQSILEALAEAARHSKSTGFLTEQVRQRLGPAIVQALLGSDGRLHTAIFDAPTEDALRSVLVRGDGDATLAPDLQMARELLAQLQQATSTLHDLGHHALVVTPQDLRLPVWRFASRFLPQIRVLSQAELPARVELVTHRTMSVPRRGAR